jgi:hypothetical protein
MRNFVTAAFSLLFVTLLYGQAPNHHEVCGYTMALEQREKRQPGYLKAVEASHVEALKVAGRLRERFHKVDTIYEIEVVFHILENPNQPGTNVHDSLVLNQLEVLNAAFQKTNADTIQVRPVFADRLGDMPVRFVLASRDPQGNATNGINRVRTTRNTFFNIFNLDVVKSSASGGVDAWDTKRYMNVWVCNLSFLNTDNLLGFAYPPVGAPFWPPGLPDDPNLEGVVVHFKVFGRNNPALDASGPIARYNQGKTCVHEVGHYLGLRHIWGDGDCTEDDGLTDTPDQDGASDNCLGRNSCAPVNEPDMFENYMDYSGDPCQVMFSRGQSDLMMANLLTFRSALPKKRVTGLSASLFTFGPVPANQELQITFFPAGTQGLKVVMYNLTGQLVLERNYDATEGPNLSLQLGALAPGMYTVIFSFDNQDHVYKVPITRI